MGSTILKVALMQRNAALLRDAGYSLERLRRMSAAQIAAAVGREVMKNLPQDRAVHYPNKR